MDALTVVTALIIILLSGGLFFFFLRRMGEPDDVQLRPLGGYQSLQKQIGLAVETGRHLHITPGRASLAGQGSPTSLAGLSILEYFADEACKNDVPPIITTGDGSLTIGAQDTLRGAYLGADRINDYDASLVRFQAAESNPFAYAAGVTDELRDQTISSNIMVGRFGSEAAIITEAADRMSFQQILGSDDPLALGVMAPFTEYLLIGEELFAVPAYLQRKPVQLASLQLQDSLRILVCAGVFLAAFYYLVVG
jgi:hypothetical protein